MTVRVNKPEFNLREKLSELDYAHVPYDKMPAGSVIRQFHLFAPGSGAENETTSTSYTDASNYKFDYTPLFVNSKIYIQWYLQTKTTDSSGSYQNIRCRKTIGGVETDAGTSSGGQLFFRGTINLGNHIAYAPVSVGLVDTPNTTSTVEYKLQQKVTGDSQTIRLGDNGQFNALICVAMEIRQ
jgi:hypothetical protein